MTFQLATERLTVRAIERADITEFSRYRNLGQIARYQEWPLPYTRDHAHELVDEMESLGRPTPGHWCQLAIDAGDGLIGDLAVWLDEPGTLAMVGYTLAPEQQGHGYATEALAALIEYLFDDRHVHRIAATIDPQNLASARVLERCGFDYIGTAASAALVRGEWTDDARFSLLEEQWRAWQRRPTHPPEQIDLVEIGPSDIRAVGALDRTFSQQQLVSPIFVSLAEALVPPVKDGEAVRPWYRAIRADGEFVGFVMLAEPFPGHPHPYLWRLVIDRRHQGRGIGRQVVLAIAHLRRDDGATHLDVSYVPDEVGSPARFYELLGFELTGEVDGGEVAARLDLTTLPTD